MPQILTSWKEISQYLGKGVRTVQRWEREAGLPVRRREKAARNAVLAIPEELDNWARSRTRGPVGPAAEILHRQMAALREETEELRKRLDRIENNGRGAYVQDEQGSGRAATQYSRRLTKPEAGLPHAWVEALNGSAENRRERVVQRSMLAGQARATMVRARLSFASTLCRMAEDGLRGSPDIVLRARQSIRKVRDSLNCPGYVPANELQDLRARLEALELRIELIGDAAQNTADELPT